MGLHNEVMNARYMPPNLVFNRPKLILENSILILNVLELLTQSVELRGHVSNMWPRGSLRGG
jgi:hypothetical protein